MIDLKSDKVGGWKCLLPLAEDKFIVAPIIFSGSVQQGEVCELFADNDVVRVGTNCIYALEATSKPEGYGEEQIQWRCGSCHMALELMQSRFADDSDCWVLRKLADGLVNQRPVHWPEIDRDSVHFCWYQH